MPKLFMSSKQKVGFLQKSQTTDFNDDHRFYQKIHFWAKNTDLIIRSGAYLLFGKNANLGDYFNPENQLIDLIFL